MNDLNKKARKRVSLYLSFKYLTVILLFFPCLIFGQKNKLYEFVGENRKHGFIDETGKIVIPPKYINVRFSGFSDELAFVSKKLAHNGDYKWICIDTLGNVRFKLKKKCTPAEIFSEGYAVIHKWASDEYWFINKDGEDVFDKKFAFACSFTNGLAKVSNYKYGFVTYTINTKGDQVKSLPIGGTIFIKGLSLCNRQIIDTLGNVIITDIDEWDGVENEFVKVKRNGKWGYIDRKGHVIIDFQYEQDQNVGFFHEGLASIQNASLFGFIDLNNEIVIQPIFKGVQYFSDGLAGVTLDGKKWGFINKHGNFVIEPQYFRVDSFKYGICGVLLTDVPFMMNDYYLDAIINKDGEILNNIKMHSYSGFNGELIKFYARWDFGGDIYYINKRGNLVIPKE